MTASKLYQSLLRAKIKSAITQARAAAELSHSGVKGRILEILIGNLFAPLLPADIGVGTGQITDSYSGKLSRQIDIILYNKAILPPILIDREVGIFPIESVLYTVEVKTTLTSTELRSAHQCARELSKDFFYRPGRTDQNGKEVHHKIEKLRSVVFALNSDLTGTGITEAQRYRDLYGDDDAFLRAICVAERDYWYDDGNFWMGFRNEPDFAEVLAFIGAVSNTYRSVSDSRGQPLLGQYVIPDSKANISTKSRDIATVTLTCESCSATAQWVSNFGLKNITINGAIAAPEKCECGGVIKSQNGSYVFKEGKVYFTPGANDLGLTNEP